MKLFMKSKSHANHKNTISYFSKIKDKIYPLIKEIQRLNPNMII